MITTRRESSVTQQQIADRLGISRQLVTHALNGTRHSRISEETREEIRRVARELNYRPRSLTTHNIGYLLPTDGAYLEAEHTFTLKVEHHARKASYRLITYGVCEESQLDNLAETFNAKTVDGVISSRWYDGKIQQFLPADVPLVLVTDEYGIAPEVDVVTSDARATLAAMTTHLLNMGHRRIGLAGSAVDTVKQHRDIIEGATQALGDWGLPSQQLVLLRGEAHEIYDGLRRLAQQALLPTAWIGTSSTYTTALATGLYTMGLRIPEDVSVMSFIDSPSFVCFPAPLAATTAFGDEVAERALWRLVQKIEGDMTPARHECVAAQILERSSVAVPPRLEIQGKDGVK